jgi:hypothetical protein
LKHLLGGIGNAFGLASSVATNVAVTNMSFGPLASCCLTKMLQVSVIQTEVLALALWDLESLQSSISAAQASRNRLTSTQLHGGAVWSIIQSSLL